MEFFKQPHGNSLVRLFANTQGRFGFEVFSCGNVATYLFQPVVVEGSGWILLDISWSTHGACLCLNGKVVLSNESSESRTFVLRTMETPSASTGLVFDGIDLDAAASSDAERLFVGSIADIDRMMEEGSWYSTIRAAGLLWQLFLDKHPVVHIVNQTYKLEIRFETVDYTEGPPIRPDFWWIYLDPCIFPNAKAIANDLHAFLNAPCLGSGDVTAKVQDLISACANAKDGRHLGRIKAARKAERQFVIDWDGAVRMLGKEPSQVAIAGICRISLLGLRPLVNAITGSTAWAS